MAQGDGHLASLEGVCQPAMLLLKTRIPVDLPIVQPETRLVLLHLCLQDWLASQDLHLENPVLILYCAHLQGERYCKEQEGFTWCPDGT